MHRGRAHACSVDLLVRQNRNHAGGRARGFHIDRGDAGMRMRRAHEHAMRLVRLRRIFHKAPKSAHQRVILHARFEGMMLVAYLIHAAASGWRQSYRAIKQHQWGCDGRGFHASRTPGTYSGTTAVASISILADFSTRPVTCTTVMAG